VIVCALAKEFSNNSGDRVGFETVGLSNKRGLAELSDENIILKQYFYKVGLKAEPYFIVDLFSKLVCGMTSQKKLLTIKDIVAKYSQSLPELTVSEEN
jgi:hypothetical protein